MVFFDMNGSKSKYTKDFEKMFTFEGSMDN